eukprot:1556711-Rhodomonas_salina.3
MMRRRKKDQRAGAQAASGCQRVQASHSQLPAPRARWRVSAGARTTAGPGGHSLGCQWYCPQAESRCCQPETRTRTLASESDSGSDCHRRDSPAGGAGVSLAESH